MCGGDLAITDLEKVVECEYCGTKQTVPSADNEKKMTLFNRANRLRMSSEFDKAAVIYESIIAEFPEEAEAYWGAVLCKYGIEYVDDPATGKKIPTCHRSSFDSVFDDEAFEQACENADATARRVYRDEAKAIEELRKGIVEVSSKEEPYDIFICYKETDENGDRTVDSAIAQDVYDALTEKGYRVFFSRITLEDKLGQEYEPYIFAALHSARIMLVFGTDYEYFNAVWVKNEWSRFLQLISSGQKKTLIPCYKDIDAYDMPKEFAKLQSQDMGKVGAIQDLLRGIDKILKPTEKANVSQNQANSATVDSLLKRAFMFLEDGDWNNANDYAEKVLDIDPECGEAYLVKAMTELNKKKRSELNDAPGIEQNANITKAIRFGNEALRKEIEGNISSTKAAIAERRKAEEERRAAENNKKEAEKKDAQEKAGLVIAAIRARINGVKEKSTGEILADAKKRLVWLKSVSSNFDENIKTLYAKRNEQNGIIGKVNELKSQKTSLGLFAIKDRKMVDEAIFNLENLLRQLNSEIEECKKRLGGYESLQVLEKDIAKVNSYIFNLEEQVKNGNESGVVRIGYEEALNLLHSNSLIKHYVGLKDPDVYRYVFNEFSTVRFGNYPQSKSENNPEPISWLILAKDKNRILLLSEYAIGCQKYNTENADVSWGTCTLRKWLNNDFFNSAFNDADKSKILTANVPAQRNPEYNTNPGLDTNDKVFLLSIGDVNKYFSSDEDRKCIPTDYAIKKGVYANGRHTKDGKPTCWWWLRSPGHRTGFATFVHDSGCVDSKGGLVICSDFAVRPALWIEFD